MAYMLRPEQTIQLQRLQCLRLMRGGIRGLAAKQIDVTKCSSVPCCKTEDALKTHAAPSHPPVLLHQAQKTHFLGEAVWTVVVMGAMKQLTVIMRVTMNNKFG